MTISQNIFNGLSADWKWASMASNGVARVHTDKPTISPDNVVLFKLGKRHTALRGEFDVTELPPEGLTPVIVERSTLASPPPYATDGKGVALDQPVSCEPMAPRVPECPQPSAFAPAPQPMAPPATVYITVDQAEAGGLWDFANPDENYVTVNTYGVVWFNRHKGAAYDRRSYAVHVNGVTHPIERTRSQPQLAPPEAGKPFATLAVDYPSAPETVNVTHHGAITRYGEHTFVWYDESEQPRGAASTLEEAKRQLNSYFGHLNGDTPDHTYTEAQFASLGAKIQKVEIKLEKARRKLDQVGQRVEFLVEHDHFDHATGLMILTGLPE